MVSFSFYFLCDFRFGLIVFFCMYIYIYAAATTASPALAK
jgi:hypothetical protein